MLLQLSQSSLGGPARLCGPPPRAARAAVRAPRCSSRAHARDELAVLEKEEAEAGRPSSSAPAERPEAQAPQHQQPQQSGGGGWWTPRTQGIVSLNLLVALCAVNWSVLKGSVSSDAVDPYTFLALRFGIGTLFFVPWLLKAERDVWLRGLEMGFWMFLGYSCQTEGLISTPASRASLISAFTVIVVPFMTAAISGSRVSGVTWLCAVLSFLGVGLLEQGSVVRLNAGDAFSLASAIFFGVQIYRTEILCKRSDRSQTLPLTAVALATTAAGGLGLLALTHPAATLDFAQHPLHQLQGSVACLPIWSLLYSALLSTDLVLFLEIGALNDVSGVEAAFIYSLEPLLGAGIANVALGERWGPLGWVGAALILAASLTSQLSAVFPTPSALMSRLMGRKKVFRKEL